MCTSIGTSETLGRGSVQYMSAGTGIRHSEMNNGDDLYVLYFLFYIFVFAKKFTILILIMLHSSNRFFMHMNFTACWFWCRLRFLQIWIKPDRYGLKPNYGSRVFKYVSLLCKPQEGVMSFSFHFD